MENLEKEIIKLLPKNKKNLARWIALKKLDGNKKILENIEKNFKIKLNIDELEDKIIEKRLNDENIKREEVKDKMISSIIFMCENVAKDVITYNKKEYNSKERIIDKILTSKTFGIPIMILFLGIIFWITIVGANYPSEWLSQLFYYIQEKIIYVFEIFSVPKWLNGVLIDGIYKTLTWIIAVMLPPMAIFFPLFTLLEDIGILPRIAFNLDKYFRKAGSSRKTSTYNVYGIWM